MSIDKDILKKLSPEERIKKLKESGEERKKEIEETEDLIKKTEAELEFIKTIPDIEVPELKPIDISSLFEREDNLEKVVTEEDEEKPSKIEYTPQVEFGEVSYTPNNQYEREDHAIHIKIEETVKYESVGDKGDDFTASRSVLKDIKKYTGNQYFNITKNTLTIERNDKAMII